MQERLELDEALLLENAGDSCWRVCDSRFISGQGRFLAFVERKDGEFEVMQLADDVVWASFPIMRDALTYIVETNSELQYTRPESFG